MLAASLVLAAMLGWTFGAAADPWKDESGKGRGGEKYEYKRERGGEWKEEYDDGVCKVERKRERSGEYKEEVKCRGHAWSRGYRAPVVVPGGVQIIIDLPLNLPRLPVGPQYGRAWREASGQYCREYQTTGVIDGRRQPLYGVACLQPDGSWAFNN
ncbi:hypothetical protein [Desertibaculum subflavum]|uniref:hypothetical protein n=1 Tax=Desertibaculum subflavum TaxID=2268458 RepID=UPI0034D2BC49